MPNIIVTNKSMWDIPITVFRPVGRDLGEILWCNHDGAETEDVVNNFLTIDGAKQYSEEVIVCDKCNAWKINNEWFDAPTEGLR